MPKPECAARKDRGKIRVSKQSAGAGDKIRRAEAQPPRDRAVRDSADRGSRVLGDRAGEGRRSKKDEVFMASVKIRKTVRWMICLFLTVAMICGGVLLGYDFTRRQIARFAALQSYSEKKAEEEAASEEGLTSASSQQENGKKSDTKDKADLGNFTIPDPDTPNAVLVYVDLGDSTSQIAEKLFNLGLIKNKALFNIMSKVNGFDGGYKSGTHYLLKGMSFDELMFILTQEPKSERVTFPEGSSYLDVKKILKERGVRFDEARMDELANDPNEFLDYGFLQGIDPSSRKTILEGYLFPDTYSIDLNSTEEQILRRMLDNTRSKLTDEYTERAKAIGMTLDQVICLASIIEKESSKVEEMYKVSRVFHNRLSQDMELQSCATVNFLRQQEGKPPVLIVRQSDLEINSPYNTYRVKGLPPGPICSPGLEAIRAALYPDTNNMDLLFFAAKGDGTTVFAKTWEEHLQNVARYVKPIDDKLSAKNGTTGETPWVELPEVKPDSNSADIEIEEIQTP